MGACLSRKVQFDETNVADEVPPLPAETALEGVQTPETQVSSPEPIEERKQEDPKEKALRLYKEAVHLEKENKDSSQMIKLYEESAQLGHVKAQLRMAFFFETGTILEKDAKSCFEWYKKAAENGEVKAQFSVAMCYYKGQGCKKDEEAAVEWFRKAADAGFERALYNLGYCYEHGN